MKELDRAIINNDLNRVIFLLKENIDCKGAVLIHLKDLLVPTHFTAEALQAKGAILTLEDLHQAIPTFIKNSATDYRNETYIKRLYLTLQSTLAAWQEHRFSNKDLEKTWHAEMTTFLTGEWLEGKLPQSLTDYSADKQQNYLEFKFLQWSEQLLTEKETNELDQTINEAIALQYWSTPEEKKSDLVVEQINKNIIDQLLEHIRSSEADKEHVAHVMQFIHGQINAQIYDGSINNEFVKDLLEQEKDRILQGKVVFDQRPFYKKAIHELFQSWQNRKLDNAPENEVTSYIKKHLTSYPIPGRLKSFLITLAITQLVEQYKHRQLDNRIYEILAKQFKSNILGHYETSALKETDFRKELTQEIYTNLFADWKNNKLDSTAVEYLQVNFLTDLQEIIQFLGKQTSKTAIFDQIKQLQEIVQALTSELTELKTKVQGEAKSPDLNHPIKTTPLTKVGMFKSATANDQEGKVLSSDELQTPSMKI